MNRLPTVITTVIATMAAMCVASWAIATDSDNQSKLSKRQMITQIAGCMKRRMAADKDSSYREAMKICKNQINQGGDNLPSGAVLASDGSK